MFPQNNKITQPVKPSNPEKKGPAVSKEKEVANKDGKKPASNWKSDGGKN